MAIFCLVHRKLSRACATNCSAEILISGNLLPSASQLCLVHGNLLPGVWQTFACCLAIIPVDSQAMIHAKLHFPYAWQPFSCTISQWKSIATHTQVVIKAIAQLPDVWKTFSGTILQWKINAGFFCRIYRL